MCRVKLLRVVWAVSHVFLVETDLFASSKYPQGQAVSLRARRKRPETFELLRTYACFFGTFGKLVADARSRAHVRYACAEGREQGFLSSCLIPRPQERSLSHHSLATLTRRLRSCHQPAELIRPPNPTSSWRTLVILNNER